MRKNGLLIAVATGANMSVVELFAFFHDSCRVNEYTDHDHGKRGADLALKLQGRMFEASSDEMSLLVEACAGHSDGCTEADISVQTCWDADRLDLGRVGIEPHPKYLCTEVAREAKFLKAAYQ